MTKPTTLKGGDKLAPLMLGLRLTGRLLHLYLGMSEKKRQLWFTDEIACCQIDGALYLIKTCKSYKVSDIENLKSHLISLGIRLDPSVGVNDIYCVYTEDEHARPLLS